MSNKDVVEKFYTAFAAQDAEGMVDCYADNVVFKDPAFGELQGERAKAMWRMLISKANGNLFVTFRDLKAEGDVASAHWQAKYSYGPSKRPVINEVDARFEFQNGKIVKHTDHFDIWKWSRMALGLPGVLLGWSPFIKNKIQKEANKGLDAFLAK